MRISMRSARSWFLMKFLMRFLILSEVFDEVLDSRWVFCSTPHCDLDFGTISPHWDSQWEKQICVWCSAPNPHSLTFLVLRCSLELSFACPCCNELSFACPCSYTNQGWTSLREIVSWVKPQHIWPNSATLSTRSRRGATYDRQSRCSSWSHVSVRSALVCRGFSISSPQLWNLLPTDIRTPIQRATTFQKETETSSHAAVHFSPLRIYVTSAPSTTTVTTSVLHAHAVPSSVLHAHGVPSSLFRLISTLKIGFVVCVTFER